MMLPAGDAVSAHAKVSAKGSRLPVDFRIPRRRPYPSARARPRRIAWPSPSLDWVCQPAPARANPLLHGHIAGIAKYGSAQAVVGLGSIAFIEMEAHGHRRPRLRRL